jgi:hypothetical protein
MTLRTVDLFVRRSLATIALLCVAGSATSSLRNHPHSLAYFNELAGGRENGSRHLLHSNLDGGQDLLFAKEWLKSQEGLPLLYFYGSFDPKDVGISFRTLTPLEEIGAHGGHVLPDGTYVVSCSLISGLQRNVPCGDGTHRPFDTSLGKMLASSEPDHVIGATLFIYFVKEGSRLRQ